MQKVWREVSWGNIEFSRRLRVPHATTNHFRTAVSTQRTTLHRKPTRNRQRNIVIIESAIPRIPSCMAMAATTTNAFRARRREGNRGAKKRRVL